MTCQLQPKIAAVLRVRNIVTLMGQKSCPCPEGVQYES
jgi:hypothetical protein